MTAGGENPAAELEDLLEFFYRTPVGLVDFDDRGVVRRVNPEAVNLLIPALGLVEFENVYRALETLWPDLAGMVVNAKRNDRLVEDHRLLGDQPVPWALTCSVVRVGQDRNMLTIIDGINRVRAEQQRDELLDSERQVRQRIEILERNATHVASATTIDELARAVLDELATALGWDLATINILQGESIRVYSGAGIPAPVSARLETVSLDADLPGAVAIRLNETIHLATTDDIRARFPVLLSWPEQFPLEALLALPLRTADKRAVGALTVTTPQSEWLTDNTVLLLNGIAGQIGQALERAQLYEQVFESQKQQRAIALRLQEALLPDRIVVHPEVQIAARYRAAGDHLTVGGDWFDTFTWPGGQVGVVVGDVAGHDLEATATMGRLRAAVAALTPRLGPSPQAVIEALDEFAQGPNGTRYATACCVILEPSSGAVSYASAGHPPPLAVLADGSIRWLDDALSPPVGPYPIDDRPHATITIEPGTTIIIYTDGLVERRHVPYDDRLAKLVSSAERADRSDAGRFADHLVADMTGDDELEDDVICVTMGWQP